MSLGSEHTCNYWKICMIIYLIWLSSLTDSNRSRSLMYRLYGIASSLADKERMRLQEDSAIPASSQGLAASRGERSPSIAWCLLLEIGKMENRPEMKLWEPSNCCCFKLKTGSILIGVSYLVCGCLGAVVLVLHLINIEESTKVACSDDYVLEACEESHYGRELGMTITFLLIACFHVVFSSLLLYGILKQKTAVFIPLMTVYAVQISLLILLTVGLIFALLLYYRVHFMFILLFGGVSGMIIYVMSYFLLVIRAHFYEIKRVKGDLHVALHEQNVEVIPNPEPQAPPVYPAT
ncbi:lysosomal-associated transmembrane protein 4B-like [Eriocheir sinensis]|uniref:lysosomal-associated transmembrane protein 4B-like n=1 Tax=Eriocheir sinensis TaxID=95602 RepID=UPI0021C645D9|nr:lysosomal-associated transmembrane protein 4B-like [Eriocheir sinensis]